MEKQRFEFVGSLYVHYRDDSRSQAPNKPLLFENVVLWEVSEVMTDTILLEVYSAGKNKRTRLLIPRASLKQILEAPKA